MQQRFEPRYQALAALGDDDDGRLSLRGGDGGRAALGARGPPHAWKLPTRSSCSRASGMGPCQGRFCMLTVAALLAQASGRGLDEVGGFQARPPVKPLPVAQLAAAWREEPRMQPAIEQLPQ